MQRLAINSCDDVTADQPRLVRRTIRRSDFGKSNPAVGSPKAANSGESTWRRYCCNHARGNSPWNAFDNRCEPARRDKENQQSNKHPGRAAHAAPASADFAAGRTNHWPCAIAVRDRTLCIVSSKSSGWRVLKADCLGILGRAFPQPKTAIPTESQAYRHWHMAVATGGGCRIHFGVHRHSLKLFRDKDYRRFQEDSRF